VTELLCLLAGLLSVGVAVGLLVRESSPKRRSLRPRRAEAPPTTAGPPSLAPPAAAVLAPLVAPPPRAAGESRVFATTVADQLAGIATGVEGSAQLLIEAAGQPQLVTRSAERLWDAVRRLRQFHDKLRAFAQGPALADDQVDVAALLAGVRADLHQTELGLTFAFDMPRSLPPLLGLRQALHDALCLLCGGLLQLERGATRMTISAEPSFGSAPGVTIECRLEWDAEPDSPAAAPPNLVALELDFAAARNLLQSQGGALEVRHHQGHAARALVRLRAADAAPALTAAAVGPATDTTAAAAAIEALPLPAGPPARRHAFGGVILLESDPTLRAMLATELKANGRAVFACADGAAARTLLQATPERFELLIVDQESRLESSTQLATAATRLCPELKVCLLGSNDAAQPMAKDLEARVRRLGKPFGLVELRATLLQLLAG